MNRINTSPPSSHALSSSSAGQHDHIPVKRKTFTSTDILAIPGKLQFRQMIPGHGRQCAFTLIEMLVVIAIIALIVALIVPGVASALDRAKRTMCASRQHSTHIALMSYLTENKGKIHLYSNYAENSSWGKELVMNGYLESDTESLVCPTTYPSHYDPIDQFWSYGMNFHGFPGWMPGSSRVAEYFITPTKVQRPSAQILLGDSTYINPQEGPTKDLYVFSNGEGCLHLRHGDMANITYADGHTKSVGLDQIRAFAEKVTRFDARVMMENGNIVSVR